jgi:tRNA pseudouridine55 synthase
MNGILIVDKPSGCTSYQVVKRVQKILKAKKVGHGGTLDPLATGVLPLFLNRATKLVPLLMNGIKRYRATLKLGVETDTLDREGNIITESARLPEDHQHIIRTFDSFKGTIEQTPPMFSALKVHGIPLYKLARKGITLERTARRIQIYDLTVIEISLPLITFEVCCSPGTYVRTLCADIGKKLGCGAHLVELTRLQSGNFLIGDSLSLDQLHRLVAHNSVQENLYSLAESFKTFPQIIVDAHTITTLKRSRTIPVAHLTHLSLPPMEKGAVVKVLCQEDHLIALIQSLISMRDLPTLSAATSAWKLVCLFNPRDNTLH